MIQATLSILIKDGKIMLGKKKTGFGKGILNGVGGKQEKGETIEECMLREAKEEIGITITKMEKIGVIRFYFSENPSVNIEVHIFLTPEYTGDVIESNEIKPFWFSLDNIPYDKMWEDDTIWLPRVLSGERDIEYDVWFDNDKGKIEKYKKIK